MDVDTSGGSLCPFCPGVAFDPLSHHAAVKAEVGYGLGRDNVNSRPADVLVQGLDRGKPTALLHRHSLLSPSVKLVWHLGQQHL